MMGLKLIHFSKKPSEEPSADVDLCVGLCLLITSPPPGSALLNIGGRCWLTSLFYFTHITLKA